MSLGRSARHINGEKVSGRHTTVIDGVKPLLEQLSGQDWLESIRLGAIHQARGGRAAVNIRRHADAVRRNTIKLIIRSAGAAQDVFLHVHALEGNETVIAEGIRAAVDRSLRHADVHDYLADGVSGASQLRSDRSSLGDVAA